jgi:serine/threonine protein kinase
MSSNKNKNNKELLGTEESSASKNDRLYENVNGNKLNYTADRIDFINLMLEGSGLDAMFTEKRITGSDFQGITDIDDVFNKKVLNFVSTLRKFGDHLLYMKSGTTGHTFKGISIPDPTRPDMVVNFAIKVVAYPKHDKYGCITDPARPENAELMMLKVLSYFVTKRHTPHIILPIATFNTKIQTFVELEKQGLVHSKRFSDFIALYHEDEFHDDVSVILEEWADGGDLLQYLRANYTTLTIKEWRVIFFQVISSIAVIQSRYPNFRHNDLKANNIILQILEETDEDATFVNVIDNVSFYIPNIGIRCKLCDFDFSCIPGIVENKKVDAPWASTKLNVKAEEHRYYDIHYFFNTMVCEQFLPNFFGHDGLGNPLIPDEVTEFITRVIPSQLRSGKFVSKGGRLMLSQSKLEKMRHLHYKTPMDILINDPFFVKMRDNSI